MSQMMAYLSIGAVRADAVFVSGLQRCDEPSAGQVRQAVAAAVRAFGCSGCAGRVAQEFGDHPETAVIRMRWARGVAREAFADSPRSPARARMQAGRWSSVRGCLLSRPQAHQAAGGVSQPGLWQAGKANEGGNDPGPGDGGTHCLRADDHAASHPVA